MTTSRLRTSVFIPILACLSLTLPGCVDEPAGTQPATDNTPAAKTPPPEVKGTAETAKTDVKKPDAGAADANTSKPAAAPTYTYTAKDKSDAKVRWITCATCHGNKGKGDGLAGMALNPKPRNFHDQEWQKTTDDARIFKAIKEGGAAVGLSPQMTANPDLSDGAVWALVEMVRKYRK